MQSTPLSNAERGFSLVELLVATTVMLAAVGTAGAFFALSRKTIQDQVLRVETLQGLRTAMDSVVRDLRLGGACLPITGDFITLDGTNGSSTATDSIFTRTGLVRPNETCVRSVTTADISASATQLAVETVDGFTDNMRVYIIKANSTTGEVFTITSVNKSTNTLQKTGSFTCGGTCGSPAYPSGSGLYAIDERRYAVDKSNPAIPPILTLTANGTTAMPLVSGIEDLQIRYQLDRNCDGTARQWTFGETVVNTACDVVDLPSETGNEWALVNQMYVTMTARSRTVAQNGQYIRVTRTVAAKPRNLLPGG